MSQSKKQRIPRIPETINFPKEEEKILSYWKEIDAFKTCLKQSKGKPKYTFYDGPPFATGLPHYGHILAGTIKDVVTRYAHQQGYHVERRFGWDCHGLPVEYEIDKKLGIKGPEDVAKMGIANYNAECRKIVMRYSEDWEKIVGRIGRWIDFKNDYKTLYPWFMETIWWIFKQLYLKGLVYKGNKVMPYSTACNTPLSNFETGQNYKDVVDPAVTVSLPLIDDKEGAALLIWTTTPWTLPSNLAACVHPDLIYARFEQISTKKLFIMLETRIDSIFPSVDVKILKTFPGRDLKGLKYEPIFDYFSHLKEKCFRVFTDDYVTAESGTGIVHQAPYFGEDDHRVCLANGAIERDQDPICPIDARGCFVQPVRDFLGQYVKDADKNIIAKLKEMGKLVHQTQIKHSYPFCWRSDTPLIYRAVPSWFIRVEHMREQLLKVTEETYWVPEFVRDKRFGNWLKEARDWSVSRNRYWGTPIPIWSSADGSEVVCVGSVEELEKLSGKKVVDLHREVVDDVEIPSRIPGNPPLKRIPEVFDCWFESGSMPYAQLHYPFENQKDFDDNFPANFIAEGIDQTRGWFYTLTVISTALFNKSPFKNLVCNGLVLASDGFKMSKSKKNYPDPMEVVDKYGADALRLYLINSPVVRAENLRFKEEGVRDVVKDVFLPWFNAFRFLLQNIEIYVQENEHFVYKKEIDADGNVMDRWILSYTQSLLSFVRKEMELYHLYNVVPRLTKFFDLLTNWYVRMNRRRLKGENGKTDCFSALNTLLNVLLNIIKIMAPFSPFLSETMFQYLRILLDIEDQSVHYLMLPKPDETLINLDIERAISRMQSVIELGRVIRDRKTIPVKYPLSEIIIVHRKEEYLNDVELLKEYVMKELNIRKITFTGDKSKFGITLRAEPDYKKLGAKLNKEFKKVTESLKRLSDAEINEMLERGFVEIEGCKVDLSEVRLIFKSESLNSDKFEVNSDNDVLILMDVAADSAMQDEGTAREIVNRVQKLRKKAHLVPTDEITVFYQTEGDLNRVAVEFGDFIENSLKTSFKSLEEKIISDEVIIEDEQLLKDFKLKMVLTRRVGEVVLPVVRWINVELVGLESRFCKGSHRGVVLLEVGREKLDSDGLRREIGRLFGVDGFRLVLSDGREVEEDVIGEGEVVFVVPAGRDVGLCLGGLRRVDQPFCKVRNFEEGGVKGCIVLENPVGNEVRFGYEDVVRRWVEACKG